MARQFPSSNPINDLNDLGPFDGNFLTLELNSNWTSATNSTSANENGTVQTSGSGHVLNGSNLFLTNHYPGQTSGSASVLNRSNMFLTTQLPGQTFGFGNTNLGYQAHVSSSHLHSVSDNFIPIEVTMTEVTTTRFPAPASAANLHLFFNGGSSSASHGHEAYHAITPNFGYGHGDHFNAFQNNFPYNFYNHYPMSALPQNPALMTVASSSSSSSHNLYREFGYPTSGLRRESVLNPAPLSQVPFMYNGQSSSAFTGMIPQPYQPASLHMESTNEYTPDDYKWVESILENVDGEANHEEPEAPVEVAPEPEPIQVAVEGPQILGDHDVIVGNDGKTHSLPREKGEPYKCPWEGCGGMFDTSQQFAAHEKSHYKYETPEQRMRRLTAKSKGGMNFQIVPTAEGPTAWPEGLPLPPAPEAGGVDLIPEEMEGVEFNN